MDINDRISEILADWTRPENEAISIRHPTITRDSIGLPKQLLPELPLVLKGVRRCGKSTLLRQMVPHYGMHHDQVVFVNFEDPRLLGSLDHDMLDLVVRTARKNRQDNLFFFFDEIQNVRNWEKWLHTKVERPSHDHFIVTGSNAHLLSGEIASVLSGRHLEVELFPFSFSEYLRLRPNSKLEIFLNEGGFPKPLQVDESEVLLQQYFDDIVERDIRERLKAKSSLPLKMMLRSIFEACGSELSMRRLAGICGLSVDTVSEYVNACENAYLIFSCPFFALSEGKRKARNKKFYPVDTALRRQIVSPQSRDLGKDFETAVFLALRRKNPIVYYWKGRGEVDFVLQSRAGIVPVQVSYDGIKPRHEDALVEFYQTYPHAQEALIITKETFSNLPL